MHFMLTYALFRFFGFFIARLPRRALYCLGRFGGWVAFYVHRPFRKKALNNLLIAYGETKSKRERKAIAIASFQSLLITLLEFLHLRKDRGRDALNKMVSIEENAEGMALLEAKQGVIFLVAHQANWEIPFLALTQRFPGIAIGKPIKNRRLYRWVLSVRESYGGTIIEPDDAIRQGISALQEGKFVGIVGDQAFPSSSYSYPLFGVRAWTSTTPALLAYKTGAPIVVGTIQRVGQRYVIKGSPPLYPNVNAPYKEEVTRMMDQAMAYLEKSFYATPEQWMWIHDRWKPKGVKRIKRIYRHGFILVILPKQSDPSLPALLRKIYPDSFITVYTPPHTLPPSSDYEVVYYDKEEALLLNDTRYQMVFDFCDLPHVRRHLLREGAFRAEFFSQDKATLIKKLGKPGCRTIAFS